MSAAHQHHLNQPRRSHVAIWRHSKLMWPPSTSICRHGTSHMVPCLHRRRYRRVPLHGLVLVMAHHRRLGRQREKIERRRRGRHAPPLRKCPEPSSTRTPPPPVSVWPSVQTSRPCTSARFAVTPPKCRCWTSTGRTGTRQ